MKRAYNADNQEDVENSTDLDKISKTPKLYHVTIVQNVHNNYYHNHHVIPTDQTMQPSQSNSQSSNLLLTQYNQQQNNNHDYDGVLNWPETKFFRNNFLRL